MSGLDCSIDKATIKADLKRWRRELRTEDSDLQTLERSQGHRYQERFLMGLDGEPNGTGVQKAQQDS